MSKRTLDGFDTVEIEFAQNGLALSQDGGPAGPQIIWVPMDQIGRFLRLLREAHAEAKSKGRAVDPA